MAQALGAMAGATGAIPGQKTRQEEQEIIKGRSRKNQTD